MKSAPVRPAAPAAGHSIEIAADAEAVWAILADFARWGEWNPLYTRSAGRLVPGERIEFTVAVPGIRPMSAKATVYRIERPHLIEYGLPGRLLSAFRYIDVVQTAPGRCTVANGEIMTGLIGPIVARFVGPKVAVGLRNMNEALKARAEAAG